MVNDDESARIIQDMLTKDSSVVGGVFGLTLISGLFSSNPEQKRSAQDFKTFDFINQTSQSLSPSFILSIFQT